MWPHTGSSTAGPGRPCTQCHLGPGRAGNMPLTLTLPSAVCIRSRQLLDHGLQFPFLESVPSWREGGATQGNPHLFW